MVYRILFSSSSPSVSSDPDIETSDDSPATPLPSEIPPIHPENLLYGKLLRLRKNLPSLVPVIDSHKYFESTIQPLFTPQNLVEQLLFQPSRDLIEDCNGSLRRMEGDGSRARKRHGVYLVEEETYGSLITDMTSGEDDYYASIEFKPKWLVQSPSAPPGYTRCRTCALRAMKFSKRKHLGETEHLKLGFCPLSLVSGNEMEIAAAATIILDLSKQVWANEEIVWQGLKEFLLTSPLLHQLKKLQIEMDPNGALRADLSSSDFLTAMTIRDCTLFLKVLPPRSLSPLQLTPSTHPFNLTPSTHLFNSTLKISKKRKKKTKTSSFF